MDYPLDATARTAERRLIILFADIDEIIDGTPEEKPKTNADRHRALSDEELANIFGGLSICPPAAECKHGISVCEDCWLEWFQQPVKEDA